jgi:hypothetical protein
MFMAGDETALLQGLDKAVAVHLNASDIVLAGHLVPFRQSQFEKLPRGRGKIK